MVWLWGLQFLAQLPQLLFYLVPYLSCIVPIKPHAAHLVLNAVRFDQTGQRLRDAFKHRLLPLLEFEFFPVRLDGFLVVGIHIPVDVGMALHKLVTNAVQGIRDVVASFFLWQFRAQFGIEDHVQHQVARLFPNLVHVLVEDRVGQLVRLLDGEVTQGLKGLFPIPWTLLPKVIHDVQQPTKRLEMLCPCIHAAKVVVLVCLR